MKRMHEVRDPIHDFIRYDDTEKRVINSRPFQRLRHIHQLALTYLVYPGATHRRFEHSLGVMELAGRVFNVVTANIHNKLKMELPKERKLKYWYKVLRLAALCHDLGHLPFSHAAEKELLPEGWNHERLTVDIIHSDEMKEIWNSIKSDRDVAEDIAKLAVGRKHPKGESFDNWEAILSEIIVGDAFGVDRMDYLLRDSLHVGVTYGKIDHHRLVDTLRILPKLYDKGSTEPSLGIEDGGLHCAEALLLARYFMFIQVYCHEVRRIYDIHLRDFLKEWLPGGTFPTEVEKILKVTDNEVTAGILSAVRAKENPGHLHAKRIVNRDHFRTLYSRFRNPGDTAKNPEAPHEVFKAARDKFGEAFVRHDKLDPKEANIGFPVQTKGGGIELSLNISEVLKPNRLPLLTSEYVFISQDKQKEAKKWLNKNRDMIISPKPEEGK